MPEAQINSALACARSADQRSYVRAMMTPAGCENPVKGLRGRAKLYAGRYAAAFGNLVERLERSGLRVERELGPRGGLWSARYRIV